MKIKDLLSLEKNREQSCQWQNLVSFYLKMTWGELQLKKEMKVSLSQQGTIKKVRSLFEKGWPVAYITGHSFFYKTDFLINQSVFIPRQETEILVERALAFISSGKKSLVMDIGSGSGCLGLSVARECSHTEVWLIESDSKAFELSKKNAKRLALRNVNFQCVRIGQELFEPSGWKGQFDLILANPPYIAYGDPRVSPRVHNFEPHQALYAKENGLYWIHKWLIWGYDFLKKDGLFIFEFGKGQDEAIASLLKGSSYKIEKWINDYSGVRRFLELRK